MSWHPSCPPSIANRRFPIITSTPSPISTIRHPPSPTLLLIRRLSLNAPSSASGISRSKLASLLPCLVRVPSHSNESQPPLLPLKYNYKCVHSCTTCAIPSNSYMHPALSLSQQCLTNLFSATAHTPCALYSPFVLHTSATAEQCAQYKLRHRITSQLRDILGPRIGVEIAKRALLNRNFCCRLPRLLLEHNPCPPHVL